MEKLNEVKRALRYLELDAKDHADNFSVSMIVSTKTMLDINEAFRALEHSLKDANACVEAAKQEIADLEQRAEAAEAKLAKQEAIFQVEASGNHWLNAGPVEDSDFTGLPDGINLLYARPAPAINLADLVPQKASMADYYENVENPNLIESDEAGIAMWDACRAAMLRNIEEAK